MKGEGEGIVDFEDIRGLIPGYIFQEYGQLTGNYVHREQIVCVVKNGRVQIWLDRDAYQSQDPERLICDYNETDLRSGRDES